jgi:hypothetical protein
MNVFRASTAAALVALFAVPAFAADVPSDPLERCKGLATASPDSPLKDAQIGNIEAVGDTGCKFTDMKISKPGDPTTVSIEEVTLDKLDFASVYNGKPSNTLVAEAKGITIDSPEAKAFLGDDAKSFDVSVDYALDPATKMFTLSDFTVSGDSLGEVALTGAFDGISTDATTAADPSAMLATAALRSIKLHFENKGIIDKVIAFATAQGEDPKTAIEQGKSQATMGMAMLSAFGVPEPAVKSLMAFAQDFPAPKGPITISAEPAAPVALAEFAAAKPGEPKFTELVKSLNVAVAY